MGAVDHVELNGVAGQGLAVHLVSGLALKPRRFSERTDHELLLQVISIDVVFPGVLILVSERCMMGRTGCLLTMYQLPNSSPYTP